MTADERSRLFIDERPRDERVDLDRPPQPKFYHLSGHDTSVSSGRATDPNMSIPNVIPSASAVTSTSSSTAGIPAPSVATIRLTFQRRFLRHECPSRVQSDRSHHSLVLLLPFRVRFLTMQHTPLLPLYPPVPQAFTGMLLAEMILHAGIPMALVADSEMVELMDPSGHDEQPSGR